MCPARLHPKHAREEFGLAKGLETADTYTMTAPTLRSRIRFTLVTAAVVTVSALATGCSTPEEEAVPRASADSAVAFAEQFYLDVLSGKPGVCDMFTTEGRADFVTDMIPAQDCEEASDVLGESVGPENVEAFTADNTYTLEGETESTVVVRADFVAYADLMTLEWVDGEWAVGPTVRVPGSDDVNPPTEDENTHEDEDGHQH